MGETESKIPEQSMSHEEAETRLAEVQEKIRKLDEEIKVTKMVPETREIIATMLKMKTKLIREQTQLNSLAHPTQHAESQRMEPED